MDKNNVDKEKLKIQKLPLRQQHVKFQAVSKRHFRRIIKKASYIGAIALFVLAGCGVFYHYETTPNQQHINIHQASKSNQLKQLPKNLTQKPVYHTPKLKSATFPKAVQGCYLKEEPIQQSELKPYYKIGSLVRITRNEIFQQFIITTKIHHKKTPTKLSTNSIKKQKQYAKMQKNMNKHIPSAVIAQYQQEGLPSKLINYNLDATVGNLQQNGNNLRYTAQMQTMISGYNTKKLYHLIGHKKLLVLKPKTLQKINIYAYASNLDLSFNHQRFHHISNKYAKQLLNENNVATYFLGFGEEKVDMKK